MLARRRTRATAPDELGLFSISVGYFPLGSEARLLPRPIHLLFLLLLVQELLEER